MRWLLGGLILIAVGVALRRVLRLGPDSPRRRQRFPPLNPEREAIFQPLAREVETHTTILGISLNDAFEERDAQHDEIAWQLMRLSASEWDRLAEILSGLLEATNRYLPEVQVVVPARSIVASRFKSPVMIGYLRLHEVLDQLVFRSKLRYQLQIRLLRRATETLTAEFRRTYRYSERIRDDSEEVWSRLDLYFHDFDMVAKESLLAFRSLLACLSEEILERVAVDLQNILDRAVRSHTSPAGR